MSWGRSEIHCVGKIKKNQKRWMRKKRVFRMSGMNDFSLAEILLKSVL